MHALIRLGDGKYYVSAVFGYYRNITATGDYQRYLEGIHKPYWILFLMKRTNRKMSLINAVLWMQDTSKD